MWLLGETGQVPTVEVPGTALPTSKAVFAFVELTARDITCKTATSNDNHSSSYIDGRHRAHSTPCVFNVLALISAFTQPLGSTVTKDELRAELERQEQRYKDVYGGEVTTYAAQPDPERKPWRKRASILDQAFAEELQKIQKELKPQEP